MTNLEQLAKIIGTVYRAYDEHPDLENDLEMYLNERRMCFETIAKEYAEVASLGTICDPDERAKALLRGMLKHVDSLYARHPYMFTDIFGNEVNGVYESIISEDYINAHWDAKVARLNAHGIKTEFPCKSDWVEMDSSIISMIQ